MHSLKQYSTFHIDVQAKKIMSLSSVQDIIDFIHQGTLEDKENYLIVWGWSNIVFTQDYNGSILHNKILGKEIIKDTESFVLVKIWSGENRNNIVERSIENGYHGIENLISIPSTMGWLPIQNVGAYGVEARDFIFEVHGVDMNTGEQKIYTNEACEFWYRSSIFKMVLKEEFFITHVVIKLHKLTKNYNPKIHYGDIETMLLVQWWDGIQTLNPRQVADTIATIRASKLPDWTTLGTAGSFFQNPIIDKDIYNDLKNQYPDLSGYIVSQDKVKLSAWEMIELVGMKWYRNWDAWVYEKHALVLVNYGNASGQEIKDLIELIQTKVKEKFWIELIPEVNIY